MRRFLRTLRLARGLSQKRLGRAADMSQNQVSKLEAGLVKEPGYRTIVRLAEVLGVPPEEIRFGVPPTPPPTGPRRKRRTVPAAPEGEAR